MEESYRVFNSAVVKTLTGDGSDNDDEDDLSGGLTEGHEGGHLARGW